MLEPWAYFEIANPEDRLFVGDDHLALFERPGWRRSGLRAAPGAMISNGILALGALASSGNVSVRSARSD